MRRKLGYAVFILGVGGLGWWATSKNAPRIEALIAKNAAALSQGFDQSLAAEVSGRDVQVDGVVTSADALAQVQSAYEAIEGVRVVDVSGIDILPLADPFELTAELGAAGDLTVTGAVPDLDTMTALGDMANTDLTLSAGVPDADWASVAQSGVGGLQSLTEGRLTLSGRDITLTGRALTPVERDSATGFIATLPEGYTAGVDISVDDDGTPLRLVVDRSNEGAVVASGKLPAELNVDDLLPGADIANLTQSILPAADTAWPTGARAAVDALSLLVDGKLEMSETGLRLTGSASPIAKAEAEEMLAALSTDFEVSSDIVLWDDGAPLTLAMDWDGATATSTGKLPADFALTGPDDLDLTGEIVTSFQPDATGAFSRNATAGVAALGLLDSGTVRVDDQRIVLTGTAASAEVNTALDALFADLAAGTQIEREITLAEDGLPAAWTLAFDLENGADLTGRLPVGIAASDFADALALADISGNAGVAVSDTVVDGVLEPLRIAADYLPETETMTYSRDGDGTALVLTLSPGVDLDLVAADLAERLPVDVALTISTLTPQPAEGTTRRNVVTGFDEAFRAGFWIPILDFTADVPGCGAEADAVLARATITFLSGSARLDAASIRAINALSAVAQTCIDAGLRLEIGGHTDSSGDADLNQILSLDRAEAVRAALAARGVAMDAMGAQGFGQSQPVADNATPEGRAENRRTSLTWLAQ